MDAKWLRGVWQVFLIYLYCNCFFWGIEFACNKQLLPGPGDKSFCDTNPFWSNFSYWWISRHERDLDSVLDWLHFGFLYPWKHLWYLKYLVGWRLIHPFIQRAFGNILILPFIASLSVSWVAGTFGYSAPLAEFSGYFAYFEFGAYFSAIQKEIGKGRVLVGSGRVKAPEEGNY